MKLIDCIYFTKNTAAQKFDRLTLDERRTEHTEPPDLTNEATKSTKLTKGALQSAAAAGLRPHD
jgi:hypothetical protein